MTDNPKPKPEPAPRPKKKAMLPAVIAIVAAVIAVAMALPMLGLFQGSNQEPKAGAQKDEPAAKVEKDDQSETYAQLAELARRSDGDPLARGKADAPVVMIAYSDFQCPFCQKFASTTEKKLIEKYVDKGTLRIEWRDFPYLGDESKVAAHAARAAANQGKFWEFHNVLYSTPPKPNSGRLTDAYLVNAAEQAGLDVGKFRKDRAGEIVVKQVQRDFDEGMTIGVNGTPAFLVNGRPIMGAQPIEVFEDAIEQAAAAK